MFEKFSDLSRKVMSLARQEAQRLSGNEIGAEHILLGILGTAGVAVKALEGLKVDLENLRLETRVLIAPTEPPAGQLLGQLPFSPRAKKAIELAAQASTLMGHGVIGTEHLLLGIIMDGERVAALMLDKHGLTLDKVRAQVVALVGTEKIEAK